MIDSSIARNIHKERYVNNSILYHTTDDIRTEYLQSGAN